VGCAVEAIHAYSLIHDDLPCMAVPHRGERPSVTDRYERGQAEFGAIVPAFGDDLWANAGGIAKRDGKREV